MRISPVHLALLASCVAAAQDPAAATSQYHFLIGSPDSSSAEISRSSSINHADRPQLPTGPSHNSHRDLHSLNSPTAPPAASSGNSAKSTGIAKFLSGLRALQSSWDRNDVGPSATTLRQKTDDEQIRPTPPSPTTTKVSGRNTEINSTINSLRAISRKLGRTSNESHVDSMGMLPSTTSDTRKNATAADPYDRLRNIVAQLRSMAAGSGRNTSTSEITTKPSGSGVTADSESDERKASEVDLERVVSRFRALASSLDFSVASYTEHDIYQPCELPYVEIAYKMCIMTEVNKKLSWEDAYSYCWRQGGELAQDSVVVKSRRYLNDLYGEAGSGARWPIWVGAKLEEAKEHDGKAEFRWRDGSQVPQFLWSQGQPRRYRKASVPRGTCMVLDGYRSFFGASLPCHFRRRFVCQRRN